MGPNVVLFFLDHRFNYFPTCSSYCLLHPIEVNILRQAPCGIVIIMGCKGHNKPAILYLVNRILSYKEKQPFKRTVF